MKNNLGQKIRKYRKRKGMSQMDLELEIGASPGSISRIENGVVNPSKETIMKVCESLDLKPSEVLDIFNLNFLTTEELLNAISEISEKKSLEDVIEKSVEILLDLYPNFNGGVLLLKRGNYLIPKTVTKLKFVDKLNTILGGPLNRFKIKVYPDSKNKIVQSLYSKEHFLVDSIYSMADEMQPRVSSLMTSSIEKLFGFSIGVMFPLLDGDEKIGALFYTKRLDK